MSDLHGSMDETCQGGQTGSVGFEDGQNWYSPLPFDAGFPSMSLPYDPSMLHTVYDVPDGGVQSAYDIPTGMRHVIDWVAEHNPGTGDQPLESSSWNEGAPHHDLGSSYDPTYTQPSTAYPSIKPQSADTGGKTREKLSEKLRGRVFTDAERAQLSANSHNAKRCRWYYRQSRKQLNSMSEIWTCRSNKGNEVLRWIPIELGTGVPWKSHGRFGDRKYAGIPFWAFQNLRNPICDMIRDVCQNKT
ncbi:hypothetical protein HD553DRAFT_326318 [Filobasidium floriforme]|uniref:uncharacterized protein n=1 Tax=Filobasidium floriforme TaxID=5210 RepID=UPI001E8DC66D|nr:uncharacterized protein HD553DRAFT_326318 [Filobasidium floriforme]KAH8080009.1 hypothetical protein HD553DRAFT_326318 [Filobasidium floriforme]